MIKEGLESSIVKERKSDKHAYLILAHKSDYVFHTLLKMIDDKRNDIFIHMDKKNRSYKPSDIRDSVKESRVYHCKSISCSWGAYSIVKAEYLLLQLATSIDRYSYYHLLSGQDLPIKSQDTIHRFFLENEGKEFVNFDDLHFNYADRVRFFYLFQEMLGRRQSFVNRCFLKMQRIVGVYRHKNVRFQKGPQWFSITDDFVRHILSVYPWVRSLFRYTQCPDELFVQTALYNSTFMDKQFKNPITGYTARHIDWKRGYPYVFKRKDFDELVNSSDLFARKFDVDTDKRIVDMIARKFGRGYNQMTYNHFNK